MATATLRPPDDQPPPSRVPLETLWLTVTEFAERYGVDRSTVYKWLAANLLETYRLGPTLRIRNLPPDQHVVGRRGATPIL